MSNPTLFDQLADKQNLPIRDSVPTSIDIHFTAEALRDKGIEKVTRNEKTWMEHAHALIARYPDSEANAEELRIFVEERLGPPAHQNAWGGMFIGAVRKGLLNNTGIYVRSSRPASHARRVPVYRINKHA